MSYERLTADNAALLLVDHQTGLSNGVADQGQLEFINNATALAKLGKLFKLPTVITISGDDGANGPLLPQIAALYPDTAVVHRPGEINPWENKHFVEAVKQTGRRKLIVAGVSTEVCLAFVALAAAAEGYDVYAVVDASGTWNKLVQEMAVARMTQAGIKPITWAAVGAELQGDWRNPTGQDFAVILAEHIPSLATSTAVSW
jgi:nicotinamidase-related amidase